MPMSMESRIQSGDTMLIVSACKVATSYFGYRESGGEREEKVRKKATAATIKSVA